MLFSVVIPVYNGERFLKECLETVEEQTFDDFEVVVVDDGSTDGTGQIADDFSSRNDNWRVFHGRNQGLLLARRKGLMYCRGEYVAFLDADDKLRADALTRIASSIDDSGADIVSFRYSRCADFSTKLGYAPGSGGIYEGDKYRDYLKAICCVRTNHIWAKAIRRSCIDSNCSYEASAGLMMGEDLFQMLPIADAAKSVAFLDDALYFYRPNDGSSTATFKHSYVEDHERVAARLLEYGRAWEMEREATHGVVMLYMTIFILLVRHCDDSNASRELLAAANSLRRVCPDIEMLLGGERLDRKLAIRAALRGELRLVKAVVRGADSLSRTFRNR